MSQDEEWRPFLGGDYEVSNHGRVRRARPGRRTYAGRVMKPTLQKIGYYAIRPVVDGKNTHRYIHHLVAEAFLGPRPDGADINHIDGDKTNNHVSNLEYVSHADNMAHAARLGLMPSGERHGNVKVTDAQVAEIRARRAAGESLTTICADYGIAKPTASEIANGIRRNR